MSKNARNERIKFLATWFNGVSLTLVGAGVVLPLLSALFRVGNPVEVTTAYYVTPICALGSLILHILGHRILGGLID